MNLQEFSKEELLELAGDSLEGPLLGFIQDGKSIGVFRNEQMDSSKFGEMSFVALGPGCKYTLSYIKRNPHVRLGDAPSGFKQLVGYHETKK